ncbi:hypothetical protein PFISCL1PPCAC_3479 [Pristionchus fissidentatus]|uniref:Nuclear receptor domain-containing protein n=1 Tax=Pristionchus fissidentatus TaxID=1538716 RepID=A0AAV5V001_9BILA|nr:hypothetical protein PFISCL1PPCAC_3479 [Pristionchus fissidentatus]
MVESRGIPSISKCLVCSTNVTSSIFGLDACRTCAAFFKRSIISRKTFVCRQGDRKCSIGKDDKFVCRRCRFDRCVEVGMEYEPMNERHRKNSPSSDSGEDNTVTSNNDSILLRIGQAYNVRRVRMQTGLRVAQCCNVDIAN